MKRSRLRVIGRRNEWLDQMIWLDMKLTRMDN